MPGEVSPRAKDNKFSLPALVTTFPGEHKFPSLSPCEHESKPSIPDTVAVTERMLMRLSRAPSRLPCEGLFHTAPHLETCWEGRDSTLPHIWPWEVSQLFGTGRQELQGNV
ncbi:hypothetical protein Bbelb_231690 [Branchiostoma belcheri]|nr:hypothetical protein Bbelb_231690 [Branchiostoma belcheri]